MSNTVPSPDSPSRCNLLCCPSSQSSLPRIQLKARTSGLSEFMFPLRHSLPTISIKTSSIHCSSQLLQCIIYTPQSLLLWAPRISHLVGESAVDITPSLNCRYQKQAVDFGEVKKVNAVGFVDRGIRKEIAFIPEIALKECNNCKECFRLCPASYLQAAFVLTEALTLPPAFSEPASEKQAP